MKKIKILLIIVISFFISVTNCFAQEIDVNKICSITGKYNYSDVSISDTKIYLYLGISFFLATHNKVHFHHL